MYSDEIVINAAKSKIGCYDQEEINKKEYLDVPLTIHDAEFGSKSFLVKFHREKINNALGWMFVELIRK